MPEIGGNEGKSISDSLLQRRSAKLVENGSACRLSSRSSSGANGLSCLGFFLLSLLILCALIEKSQNVQEFANCCFYYADFHFPRSCSRYSASGISWCVFWRPPVRWINFSQTHNNHSSLELLLVNYKHFEYCSTKRSNVIS